MKKAISLLLVLSISIGLLSCFSVLSFAASSYYFDSVNGNDGVWSNSASKPYKSLDKLNSKSFSSGSTVYIKRGSVYRGQLVTQQGVTYTAYGEGNAPMFLGSDDAHQNKWQTSGYTNIWVYNESISSDVGNIIFDEGERWGYKQIAGVNGFSGNISALDSDLEFYHSTDGKVYLYSKTNPYTRFNSIEFAKKVASASNSNIQHLVVLKSGVTIDGLCLKYCGNHAVHGNTVSNVTVKNCEIGWIGGSVLSGTTRYGNAVELWDNCSNVTIQNNYMYQIYDTGITAQCTEGKTFSDFTVTGNTIDYCTFSFEYYLPDGGIFKNINVSENTFNYAGYGWGAQRPDKDYTAHINSWNFYKNYSENFVFSNNVFNGSTHHVFITDSSTKNTVTLSGNTYNQCDYLGDSCANPQLLTWYEGTKYQFGTDSAASVMQTLDPKGSFGYCSLPIDYAKVCSIVQAIFGKSEPTVENLAKYYSGNDYSTLFELMGFGENCGIVDFYYAIKNKYSVNWESANNFIKENESTILALASSEVMPDYEITFANEFDFDTYNWNGVWSAESEVDYNANSYTLKNLTGDAQNNTYNGDYCGGKVQGAMHLISGHTYRLSYSYKNNTALDGVNGNIRLFGFETSACTGSMYTISPVDGSSPTWTASANESGTYTCDVIIPQKNNYVTVRCNAFNCNGASVTFSDIYICDITNGLPCPQVHTKTVKDSQPAGDLPELASAKYNFLGWYTARDNDGNGSETQITKDTVINSNIRVFPKWELKGCYVSINTDGGDCTGISYQKAESGKLSATEATVSCLNTTVILNTGIGSVVVLPAPSKENYKFAGWLCNGNVLPQDSDGKSRITVSSNTEITALWNKNEVFVYNLYAGITASEFIRQYIDTEKYSASYNTATFGTDTLVTVTDKETGNIVKQYRIVIFGDVNGDGMHDGRDAIIVNCIYQGMISRSDISEAVYMAADCNHDGSVDSDDVKLLNRAGVFLTQIEQSNSSAT